MADKKSDLPEESSQDKALEKKVDAMMNARDSDVAQLADSFNKQFMTEKPDVKPDVVKPVMEQTSAPELPSELKKQIKEEPEPAAVPPKPDAEPVQKPEAETEPKPGGEFDDSETDKAVEDIVAKEGDLALAVEDAKTARTQKAVISEGGGFKGKLGGLFKNKWTWIVIVVLLVAALALPMTRYKILGLAIKKSATITVVDSKTGSPVSSAQVQLAGDSVKTDANGKARLRAGVGKHGLLVTKKYYSDLNSTYFVGFKDAPASQVKLVATGRLVPVTVINKITSKPVAGAQVQVSGTTAKTNSKGQAEIALPAKASSDTANLTLAGYNPGQVTIQVTDKIVKANTFELTPAGHIYFLSNLKGSLDVVKANLDGSGRKTVLEGTGKEEAATTSLLASRDWRYLALKSRREGNQAALYLIDTSNDKVTQFDTSNADFNLVGWYDHSFIYSLTRKDLGYWQPGRQLVKSYDAEHQQLNQLDQSLAEGDSGSYVYQNLGNFYILNGAIAYTSEWSKYGNSPSHDLSAKNDTIRTIQPSGQNKKDYQSFPAATTSYIQGRLYEPQGIYYSVYDNSTNKTAFYTYEDQAVKTASIDQGTFDQPYPTFLLSPSGNQTFWTELRDGKNALFTGDPNAKNKKQIASLSQYAPYGWYSDNYVLVSKNSSELYIASPGGLTDGQPPLKLTDYYKPAQTYSGYGYGYGGL